MCRTQPWRHTRNSGGHGVYVWQSRRISPSTGSGRRCCVVTQVAGIMGVGAWFCVVAKRRPSKPGDDELHRGEVAMDERVMLVMAMLLLQDYCQCTSRGSAEAPVLGRGSPPRAIRVQPLVLTDEPSIIVRVRRATTNATGLKNVKAPLGLPS